MNTFKKTLAGIALFCSLSASSSAELVFNWNGTNFSNERKKEIIEAVKEASLSFTNERYADFGIYNFIECKQKYKINFGTTKNIALYKPAQRLFLFDTDLLNNMDYFKGISVHEFSHAYDYEHMPNKIITPKNGEYRAESKEWLYHIDQMRLLPKERKDKVKKIYLGVQELSKNLEKRLIKFDEFDDKWRELLK